MKDLLFEYLIKTDQLENFKKWLLDSGIETEGGITNWIEIETKDI